MPSFALPVEFTDVDGNVLVKIDEGGAILQYDPAGNRRAEIYDGVAVFDAAGNRLVDVKPNGGVTVWRPGGGHTGGLAIAQVWDGGVTTYAEDGTVTGQLPAP